MSKYEIIENEASDHIHKNTEMWGGSKEPKNQLVPVLTENEIYEFNTRNISDCLYTCINELLSNCYDHSIRCNKMTYFSIKFNISDNSIITKNNGTGIPSSSILNAFNRPFTGSRSTTESKLYGISGHSGIGTKITNACAEKFIVYSVYNKMSSLVVFKPQNRKIPSIITKKIDIEDQTIIEFVPDKDQFIYDLIEYIDVFRARCLHIKWFVPNLTIYFNDTEICKPIPQHIFEDSFIDSYRFEDSRVYLFIDKDKLANKIPTKYVLVNGMDATKIYKRKTLWGVVGANLKKYRYSKENAALIKSLQENLLSSKIDKRIFMLFIIIIDNPRWDSNKKLNITNKPDLEIIFNNNKLINRYFCTHY